MNGVLRTSDEYLVVTKRAMWVGEPPGMLDTPGIKQIYTRVLFYDWTIFGRNLNIILGGHPEPSSVDDSFNLKLTSSECFERVAELDAKSVVKELFKSQKEEMELEFNISRHVYKPIICICIHNITNISLILYY